VAERATYEDPRNLSRGMEFVLIDGEVVVEDGIPTGKRPGEVLRSTEVWAGDRRPTLRSRT
jgi:N-acyl-D-amino-acid deacylase